MTSKKKLIALFWLIAVLPLFSAEDQKITIKSSSVKGKVLTHEAVLAEKPVELVCFLSEKSCTMLESGDYLMVRLTKEAIYQDCPNVDIYSKGGDATKRKLVGEYCLLES
jgi:hypothetical protein